MPTYLPFIESHLHKLAAAAAGDDTSADAAMWPAVVDTRTGQCLGVDHVPERVYRLIGAPGGSTAYWDQPLLVAAHALTRLTGDEAYAAAADRYIEAFLDTCVDGIGMFQWGNHQYYDLHERRVVEFSGGVHELRPVTPAWDIFWRLAPERTETYIRTMARRHVYDPASGGFNRHDNGRKGHAFLEAGGILAESLAWLHGKTGDAELTDLALRIARYSYGHRNPSTGLVPNEPDHGRWDAKVSTSEIGLWAQSLLRAAAYTREGEFTEMARRATLAYVEHAYDDSAGLYVGQVAVDSGTAVNPAEAGYWPGQYSDPWNAGQWPTHDYPMATAEACLTLHAMTGEPAFLEAVRRWADIAGRGSPLRHGGRVYAEQYGRCVHFLARAGLELGDERLLSEATGLADEAADGLFEGGMFRGYPDGHVYESVDGVGYLALALMLLETRLEPDLQGFGF